MLRPLSSPAAVLLGALAALGVPGLTACGAGHPSSGTTPSTPSTASSTPTPQPSGTPTPAAAVSTPSGPATGARIAGTGYSFRVPSGWRDVTAKLGQPGVDRAAAASTPVGGFRSNVNVVRVPKAIAAGQLAAVVRSVRARMLGSAPHYAVRPPTSVDGTVGGHLAGVRTQGGTRYWLEQFVLPDARSTLVVSFSFSPRLPAADRSRTIDAVLASWRWR